MTGAVFADISWVGFTGASVPAEMSDVFAAARDVTERKRVEQELKQAKVAPPRLLLLVDTHLTDRTVASRACVPACARGSPRAT